jgi:hypothetical protein
VRSSRLLAISAAFRGRAAKITTELMLVTPGVFALAIWLLAPRFGPLNGDQILVIVGVLIVAILLGSFIPIIVLGVRGPGTRR